LKTKQKDLIRYKDGNLFCELANIWIDPSKPVKRALITHAHFDHFTFGCEEYLSTKRLQYFLKKELVIISKLKFLTMEKNLTLTVSIFHFILLVTSLDLVK